MGFRTTYVTAQPSNDNYSNALLLNSTTNWSSLNGEYTTKNATADASRSTCQAVGPSYNVWFKFVAKTTRVGIRIESGNGTGTLKKPYLALWNSNNTEIACKAYSSTTGTLVISSVNLEIGATYFISVDNLSGLTNRGTFKLSVDDSPYNDYFEEAFVISSLNNWCSGNGAYSNSMATADQNRSTCQASGPNKNVWFKFEATTSNLQATLKTGGGLGSLQQGFLTLWNSGLTQLTCASWVTATGNVSLANTALISGNTYYLSVDNVSGVDGTFTLCVSDAVNYDFIAGAQEIISFQNYISAADAYSTSEATADGAAGSCWGTGPNNNRWFKFRAPSGDAKIDLIPSGMTFPMLSLWNSSLSQINCIKGNIANGTITINASGLTTGEWYYLSVDNKSGNAGAFRIGLDFTSVGGVANGSQTHCAAQNNGQITLAGNIGSVVMWQSSTTNGASWSDISNTTSTLNYSNLPATTQYRAVIKNGSWPQVYSDPAVISVTTSPGFSIDTSSVACGSLRFGVASVVNLSGNSPFTYQWSTGSTSASISNLVTGNYTATVTDMNECATTHDAAVVSSGEIVTGSISGQTNMCTGSGQTLTLSGHDGNILKWQSSVEGGSGWVDISNTATSLIISNMVTSTSYRAVIQQAGCGEKSTDPFQVTVLENPVVTFNVNDANCFGGNNGSLVFASVTGETPHTFLWNNGANTSSITDLTAGSYTLTVTDNNGCTGSSVWTVSQPGNVTTSVAGATKGLCGVYETTMEANTPVVGIGSWRRISGTGTPDDVNNPLTRISGLSNGTNTFAWVINSGSCDSSVSWVDIIVDTQPYTGVVSIVNPMKTCIGDTISVSTDAPGTNYTWSIDPAGTFISGQGTATLSIVLGNTTTSSFSLCVLVENGCGPSPMICKKIRHRPSFPQTTSAPQAVCAGQTIPYAVYAENAALYEWTGPAGMLFNNQPAPLLTPDSSVMVTFPAGFTSGAFFVSATSGCVYTDLKRIDVSTDPIRPGIISGKKSNVCNSTQVYTIKARDGSPFIWTAPAGSVVSNVSSGTDSVWVTFQSGFKSGRLSVVAKSPCGVTSAAVSIAVINAPATPGAITGPIEICPNTQNNAYSVTDMEDAESFAWSVRDDANIINQGQNSVQVDFGLSVKEIMVSSVSSCGTSIPRKKSLLVSPACRTVGSGGIEANQAVVLNSSSAFNLQAYPDADQRTITFTFYAESAGLYNYFLLDVANREILSGAVEAVSGVNMVDLDLSGVSESIFKLKLENGQNSAHINITLK